MRGDAAAAADGACRHGSSASVRRQSRPTSIWERGLARLAAKANAEPARRRGRRAHPHGRHRSAPIRSASRNERETQVGQQSQYVGAFNALAAAGVTIQDLQALMAAKRGGPAAAAPGVNGNARPTDRPTGARTFSPAAMPKASRFSTAPSCPSTASRKPKPRRHLRTWNDQPTDLFSGPESIQDFHRQAGAAGHRSGRRWGRPNRS